MSRRSRKRLGVIWEGTPEQLRQIIPDVKAQIEGMTEEEKEKLGCLMDNTSPDASTAAKSGS